MMPPCRSVPFAFSDESGKAHWLLPPYVINAQETMPEPFLTRLRSSIDFSSVADVFDAEVAEELVTNQYDAAVQFIFSHPLWERMRGRHGSDALSAYVLETRHYLHAAPWRMAPGAASSRNDIALAAHLAEHVAEEADHARFFEDALAIIGCAPGVIQRTEPLPGTIEWSFLMSGLSSSGGINAGIASGVMEYTATDRDLVNAWHRHLVVNELMTPQAIEAFRRHVDLDAELGHGSNWREMIRDQDIIDSKTLARALNVAATVAEGVRRWSDQAGEGLAAVAIDELVGASVEAGRCSSVDPIPCARRVWHAAALHDVAYGRNQPHGYRRVLAAAYFADDEIALRPSAIAAEGEQLRDRISLRVQIPANDPGWKAMLVDWQICIDGHELWAEMREGGGTALIEGWLLENYHYLASSPLHVAAGIAACPDVLIRSHLVKHLAEEAGHEKFFLSVLRSGHPSAGPSAHRPLSSTAAFTSFLANLAQVDWKAYVIALTFLQFTLEPHGNRQKDFYRHAGRSSPRAAELLNAMRRHDLEDQRLGHDGDANELLAALISRHDVTRESIQRAARVTTMAWSFLDGIRRHYAAGPSTVVQRMGWRARGM